MNGNIDSIDLNSLKLQPGDMIIINYDNEILISLILKNDNGENDNGELKYLMILRRECQTYKEKNIRNYFDWIGYHKNNHWDKTTGVWIINNDTSKKD